jgi:choline kinase
VKAVILAAGSGRRFGDKTLPKPLTLLCNGQSILEQQIHHLQKYFALNDIIIVVGYHKEQITTQFPDCSFVINNDFAIENTSKSLLKAIHNLDDDVLWLNGDVVFHPHVLTKILHNPRTSMVVNEGSVGDEEVKYRLNSAGQIVDISKTVAIPQGEAVGINLCEKKDLGLLRSTLHECFPNDYFEKAIEKSIAQGMVVWPVVVDSSACIEIDFEEDLTKANKLLTKWTKSV